jgi:hypothetical protein
MPDMRAFGRFRQTQSNPTKVVSFHAFSLPSASKRLMMLAVIADHTASIIHQH